jgi:hypothetical protein
MFFYDGDFGSEKILRFYDTFMGFFERARICFFLPLENLFMANFSRNHIEKQVFNIGDLSPM